MRCPRRVARHAGAHLQIPVSADDIHPMDAMTTALSGMQSAQTRISTSAHNLANLLTRDFEPLRSDQVTRASGGSEAHVSPSGRAEPVSIAREVVDQIQASTQYTASLRVLEVGADLRGSLLDILA